MVNNIESISQKEELPVPLKIPVTDKDILVFAKQILVLLFVSFVLCLLAGVLFKVNILFEIIKVEIFPSFTLVVAYYFWKLKK